MLAQGGMGLPNLAAISGPTQQVQTTATIIQLPDKSLGGDYGKRQRTERLIIGRR